MKTIASVLRWIIVALVIGGGISLIATTVVHTPSADALPENVRFEEWYGNWRAVLFGTAVFTLFLLGFARPRRRMAWRNAGVYIAFLISLFTEMFGSSRLCLVSNISSTRRAPRLSCRWAAGVE